MKNQSPEKNSGLNFAKKLFGYVFRFHKKYFYRSIIISFC